MVSDASVPRRWGVQSSSWSEGLELCYRKQDQNYEGEKPEPIALLPVQKKLVESAGTGSRFAKVNSLRRLLQAAALSSPKKELMFAVSAKTPGGGVLINGLPCLLSTFRPLWTPKLANYSLTLPAFNVVTRRPHPSVCYDEPYTSVRSLSMCLIIKTKPTPHLTGARRLEPEAIDWGVSRGTQNGILVEKILRFSRFSCLNVWKWTFVVIRSWWDLDRDETRPLIFSCCPFQHGWRRRFQRTETSFGNVRRSLAESR